MYFFVVVQMEEDSVEELLPLNLQEEHIEMLIDYCTVLNFPTLGIPSEQLKENIVMTTLFCIESESLMAAKGWQTPRAELENC